MSYDETEYTDEAEAVDLGILDPSIGDETYWSRFRFRVMTRAADELFRRRMAAEVSVVGVVEGWSRTLAPVAAIAAAIAGFLLLSNPGESTGPLAVEEALTAELDDPGLPADLEEGRVAVQFASEEF